MRGVRPSGSCAASSGACPRVEVEALIADYEAGGLARDYGIHRTPVSAHMVGQPGRHFTRDAHKSDSTS
jgi:hypothetical protein